MVKVKMPNAAAEGFSSLDALLALVGFHVNENESAATCAARLASVNAGRQGREKLPEPVAVATGMERIMIDSGVVQTFDVNFKIPQGQGRRHALRRGLETIHRLDDG